MHNIIRHKLTYTNWHVCYFDYLFQMMKTVLCMVFLTKIG